MSPVTALSRLVEEHVHDRGWSSRQVAEASRGCPAGPISQAAVAQYRTGRHPRNPSDRILRILSWTLNIPLPRLQDAAGVPESLEDWVPPPEAHQLSRQDREMVTALIKRLAGVPLPDEGDVNVTVVDVSERENPPVPGPDDDLTKRRRSARENGPANT